MISSSDAVARGPRTRPAFSSSRRRRPSIVVLDYALEAVTVVSLFAAVAGIQQSAIGEILQRECARPKASRVDLCASPNRRGSGCLVEGLYDQAKRFIEGSRLPFN